MKNFLSIITQGAKITHGNYCATAAGVVGHVGQGAWQQALTFGPEDSHLSYLPLAHSFEQVSLNEGQAGSYMRMENVSSWYGQAFFLLYSIASSQLKFARLFPFAGRRNHYAGPRRFHRIFSREYKAANG